MQHPEHICPSPAPAQPVHQSPVAGLYALLFTNNWDGEGDQEYVIAKLSDDGVWTRYENGSLLFEYVGDKIISAWPLFESTPPAACVQPVQDEAWKAEQKDLADYAIKCATQIIAENDGPMEAVRAYYGIRTSPAQTAEQEPVAIDTEGENMAVRAFLMRYGEPGLTVGQMKKHMDMSGHSCCPVWVYTALEGSHLTKAGAQLWIRHLLALEAAERSPLQVHATGDSRALQATPEHPVADARNLVMTGAALRKLHNHFEPLASMKTEGQVSAWWEYFAANVRLELSLNAKPGSQLETLAMTGAALRKLHDDLEPLSAMENEAQVSAWWKHFAAKVRLELKLSAQPEPQLLTVRLMSFPESNGKKNWTAMLTRTRPWGGLIGNAGGITLDRGECWNRVAYEAERTRFLLGERTTEPSIWAYGEDVKTPEEWLGVDPESAFGISKGGAA